MPPRWDVASGVTVVCAVPSVGGSAGARRRAVQASRSPCGLSKRRSAWPRPGGLGPWALRTGAPGDVPRPLAHCTGKKGLDPACGGPLLAPVTQTCQSFALAGAGAPPPGERVVLARPPRSRALCPRWWADGAAALPQTAPMPGREDGAWHTAPAWRWPPHGAPVCLPPTAPHASRLPAGSGTAKPGAPPAPQRGWKPWPRRSAPEARGFPHGSASLHAGDIFCAGGPYGPAYCAWRAMT
jgi:hypothetical protein